MEDESAGKWLKGVENKNRQTRSTLVPEAYFSTDYSYFPRIIVVIICISQ